jgi:hypothetical protein
MLKVLDILEELGQVLSSGEIKSVCHDLGLLPLKVVLILLDTNSNKLSQDTPEESCKRVKIDSESKHILTPKAEA